MDDRKSETSNQNIEATSGTNNSSSQEEISASTPVPEHQSAEAKDASSLQSGEVSVGTVKTTPKTKKIVYAAVLSLLAAGIIMFIIILGVGSDPFATAEAQVSCLKTDNIEHCLSVDKNEVSITESFELTATIKNVGNETLSENFPCIDNSPTLKINGNLSEPFGCLNAVSNVTLEPGESEEYILTIAARGLDDGENTISAVWGGYTKNAESGTVTIKRHTSASESKASETCTKSSDVVDACAQIMAVFVEGTTPEQAAAVFESYNLTLITQINYDGVRYVKDEVTDELVCEESEGSPAYDENLAFYTANVPLDSLAEVIQRLTADSSIDKVYESIGGLVQNTEPVLCEDSKFLEG